MKRGLSEASSNYLRRHASNPVDWMLWKEDVFEDARKQDKLVVISIGYSSCHWCHVMEDETFMDPEIAAFMNQEFMSVKVDREERPDIDKHYMRFAQLLMDRAGWPLNVISLPDGRPIHATTYLPRDEWFKTLKELNLLYEKAPEKLQEYADHLKTGVASPLLQSASSSASTAKEDQYLEMMQQITLAIDTLHGGFPDGDAKFPKSPLLNTLLDYVVYSADSAATGLLKHTLDQMSAKGLQDHLGGGFFRYTTDPAWEVPHFEKMLYDNALLLSVYSKAFSIYGDSAYLNTVSGITDFLFETLSDQDGLFYGSTDAQTNGEEGAFYLWKPEELPNLLDGKPYLLEYYGIQADGPFEGKFLPMIQHDLTTLSRKHKLTEDKLKQEIDQLKSQWVSLRNTRKQPAIDKKLILSWNALAVIGLCDAFQATGDSIYLNRAISNARVLGEKFIQKDGKVARSISNDKIGANAMLDDYSNYLLALIKLYELTFEEEYLQIARHLNERLADKTTENAYHLPTYSLGEEELLFTTEYDLYCNETPSSTATYSLVQYYLGKILGRSDTDQKAQSYLMAIQDKVGREPVFYATWLKLMGHLSHPYYEVAIVGEEALARRADFLKMTYPYVSFLGSRQPSDLPVLDGKYREGFTYLYVCTNGYCQLPVQDVNDARKQLILAEKPA
ncbi:MAG: thioredoxin domain-containing protein [Cyclobacteriaceae bacterium]